MSVNYYDLRILSAVLHFSDISCILDRVQHCKCLFDTKMFYQCHQLDVDNLYLVLNTINY